MPNEIFASVPDPMKKELCYLIAMGHSAHLSMNFKNKRALLKRLSDKTNEVVNERGKAFDQALEQYEQSRGRKMPTVILDFEVDQLIQDAINLQNIIMHSCNL